MSGPAGEDRGAPQRPYRTRLEMVFASNAPVAVILRRGPKRHYHLIEWNLKDDTFRHGQWMKGIVRLCHLSPSGDRLLYWAAQYHMMRPEHERVGRYRDEGEHPLPYEPIGPSRADAEAFLNRYPKRKLPRYMQPAAPARGASRRLPPRALAGVWTAISRPPWFSALALWPSDGHWSGGGYLRSDDEVVLFEREDGLTPIENVRMPARVRVSGFQRNDPRCNRDIEDLNAGVVKVQRQLEAVVSAMKAAGHDVLQVQPHANGALYIAMDGKVFSVPDWIGVPADQMPHRARQLADFNGLKFEMMRAPATAMRWS